ncbi:hypothetical protein OG453_20725 [Streptomyces sp. NBC_01381]|uniref:hypothetical protein n=1 Tax=Streptomyces sp. NBC_01381 TaxID=2903845 RepID=UPI00224FC00E|nr:hypothetical protein [Streptomyces sp. NBC_01381]MCX4669068.1 hypothetical protein [Streptomyces sp. NBC_01381]
MSAYVVSPDRRVRAATLRVAGEADPDTRYRVTVGVRSRTVSGADLMSEELGPFPVARGEVTPITLTPAEPAHDGEDLKAKVTSLTLTPQNDGRAGVAVR